MWAAPEVSLFPMPGDPYALLVRCAALTRMIHLKKTNRESVMLLRLSGAMVALLLSIASSFAQNYPNKSVRVVVGRISRQAGVSKRQQLSNVKRDVERSSHAEELSSLELAGPAYEDATLATQDLDMWITCNGR